MCWNYFGLAAVVLVTGVVSRLTPDPVPGKVDAYTLSKTGFYRETRTWWRTYLLLAVYFLVIFAAIVGFTIYASHRAGAEMALPGQGTQL
jgi:hypothetical protein